MDLGQPITCDGSFIDSNYYRHVGWSEQTEGIQRFFNIKTLNLISEKVSELTRGVDRKNRKIVVPQDMIAQVMDSVYQKYRLPTGDIYSRYIVSNDSQQNMVQSLIDQTIEVLTDTVRNQYGMEEENSKLSAWVQVYGDFNAHNLTQTPPIKIRGKRPAVMQFHMNY
jgi:hypothetical protein